VRSLTAEHCNRSPFRHRLKLLVNPRLIAALTFAEWIFNVIRDFVESSDRLSLLPA
jgi:hypothetical protein